MKNLVKKQLPIINNQNGSSLVLALLVSFMLIAFVTVSVHFSNTELISAKKQDHQISAYYIAEAGIERAILEINHSLEKGLDPVPTISDTQFEGGSYETTITPKLNEKGENIGYIIDSLGVFQGETEKISRWVKQTLWNPGDPLPNAFEYAIFADNKIDIQTISGLLGLGFISSHEINVYGNIHANEYVNLKHNALLPTNPKVSGFVSSTNSANIHVSNLPSNKKQVNNRILQPKFDFDYARRIAQKNGVYVNHSVLSISLLGLSFISNDKPIFIDGDLTLTGLDLLGIAIQDRTFIVSGSIFGIVEAGGNLLNTKLNLIAKDNITFAGAVTGLHINGILYAQEDITTEGHLEVDGYMGAKNIACGTKLNLVGGLLENILSLVTGDMKFTYNRNVFDSLPANIGFRKKTVEVVEDGVATE